MTTTKRKAKTKKQKTEDIAETLENISRKLLLILPVLDDVVDIEERKQLETIITDDIPALRKLII